MKHPPASQRDFSLNVPPLFSQFISRLRCILGGDMNEKEFLPLIAVDPG
ncbi:hypothetical protein SynA1825c_00896 [Synechococcus sp. A18-25c]|nr:hypothetical protein SynA1560_00920 [Synechococcus sp. A15-60]QNJ19212.1 hypothetical protein SynA1825c_00896 [Synechococcus sp. A18-25c]